MEIEYKSEEIIAILNSLKKERPLPISIEVLKLSSRVHNALSEFDLNTIDDLIAYWEIIPCIKRMGTKGFLEVFENLHFWYQQDHRVSLPVARSINFQSLTDIPIERLDLPYIILNSLKRNQIHTIGDIFQEWKKISSIKNFGSYTFELIQAALISFDREVNLPKLTNNQTKILNRNSLALAKKLPLAPIRKSILLPETQPMVDLKKEEHSQKEVEMENILIQLSEMENEQPLAFSIEILDLSIRVRHSLLREGIKTISDLVNNWSRVPHVRNLGTKGILEITEKLNLWYQNELNLPLGGYSDPVVATLEVSVQSSGKQKIDRKPFDKEDLSFDFIEKLDLSPRSLNVLKRMRIKSLGQLYEEWELISTSKNVGPKTMREIQQALTSYQNSGSETADFNGETSVNDENNPSPFSEKDTNPAKIRIERLDITQRACQILKRNNIHTIDQITSAKLEELRSNRVIGFLTLRQIIAALQLWLSRNEKRKIAYLEVMRNDGVIRPQAEIKIGEYINSILEVLDPRLFSIIECRYGLRTGKKSTLAETAKQFGITRERIRQIESHGIILLKRQFLKTVPSPLYAKIEDCIDGRGGLISKSRLETELLGGFNDTGYSAAGMVELIFAIFGKEISLDHKGVRITYLLNLSAWSTSSYDVDQILLAANKIVEFVSSATSPLEWSSLFSALVSENGLLTLDEKLAHAIALCLSDTQQILRQMDGTWSKKEKITRTSRIISVMRQMGQPAHFSEIAECYQQTFPEWPQSEHNVHAVISGCKDFVRIGRGKYGLAEWGMHDDGNVGNAIRRILAAHRHPMPMADIEREVLITWDVQKSAIWAAVETDARFSKTEDAKIWLTETGLTIKKRIKHEDMSRGDRLMVVLRENGRPAPVQLIVEIHNQAHPDRPFTVSAAKQLMFRRTEHFTLTGLDEFGLAEWGLERSKAISRDRTSEILEIIKEQTLVSFESLLELYNQRYSDRPISTFSMRNYLSKLKTLIASPNRNMYRLADQPDIVVSQKVGSQEPESHPGDSTKIESESEKIAQPAQHDDRFGKILKIFNELNHPQRVILILERYNQLNPEDRMKPKDFMDYLMYVKAHPEMYPSGFMN